MAVTTNPQNTVVQTLNVELTAMDNLLNDPNCDHGRVLEQAYRVLMLMSRMLGQTEKLYVLDQEPELYAQVKKLKGTYNTWTVLAITIVSGSLSIGGGFIGIGAAIPGTSLGELAANSAPNTLGWLSNLQWGKNLSKVGQGVGGVGTGTGAFGSLASNSAESKRALCNYVIEEIKRKRSDREEATRQQRGQVDSASNNCKQTAQAAHQAASNLLMSAR